MGTEFDSKLAYNKKYIKTKIKFYGSKTNSDFYNQKQYPKKVLTACLYQ